MYVTPNFKTKKAFKEALANGQSMTIFQPNNIFGTETPKNGVAYIEGPHFPEPHRWYATVQIVDGKIVKIS